MSDTIPFSSATSISARLKEARTATGMSTRAVAEFIRKKFPGNDVSHTSIANYESGRSAPSINLILVFAAVYERPATWFLESGFPLSGIQYRQLSSRVRVKDRHQFEVQVQHILEGYVRLEKRLRQPLIATKDFALGRNSSPMKFADQVRAAYGLRTNQPIKSVVEILEAFGIRVIEMPTQLRVDGLAAMYGGEPVVVLNPSVSNDRIRLSAAHELKHVLDGDCESPAAVGKKREDEAFEFACHLLIPVDQLESAFVGHSAVRLLEFKLKFGISMAAMIYRAEKLRIIDGRTAKQLWIHFSRKGWRAKEPGHVHADRACRFERMLAGAISTKRLTLQDAVSITGISDSELQRRLEGLAMGEPEEEQGGPVLKIRSQK